MRATGASHRMSVFHANGGFKQHELAVARDDEVAHRFVAVAGRQALAHEKPEIARQRRVRIVDRLVLADEASEARREMTRPRLERRIGQDLVRLDGIARRAARQQEARPRRAVDSLRRQTTPCMTTPSLGWNRDAARRRARTGAPILSRRSESDTAPPMNMISAPIQMKRTSGLK